MNNVFKNTKGFSVMEIMVAVFVVSMGMAAVLTLVKQSVTVQTANKKQVVASMLSQEGIELVRKRRDENWLNGRAFNYGLADGVYLGDYTGTWTSIIFSSSDDPAHELKINSSGLFQHFSGVSNSSFYRYILIDNFFSYLRVTSLVRYKSGGSGHSYMATTYLYDWGYY